MARANKVVGDHLVEIALTQAVLTGVEKLSGVDPYWYEVVDPDSLNMSRCEYCVLGQWAEARVPDPSKLIPFDRGLVKLGITLEQACFFGFNPETIDYEVATGRKVRVVLGPEHLKYVWKLVIQLLRVGNEPDTLLLYLTQSEPAG